MKLIFGADEYVCSWISTRIDIPLRDGKAIGVARGDRLIGAVAYTNWRVCDIEMSCAADDPRWLNRSFLHTFFAYPFLQLRCLRVTIHTAKKNKRAREFVERIGFKLEGVHPRALDGRDACSYGMLRERCKWLRIDNGQAISVTASRA